MSDTDTHDASPLIFDRYRLLDKLGEGGMGQVYHAEKRGAEGFIREVALKIVHPHLALQARFRRGFINEGRLGGQLKHPNIVQTQAFDEHESHLYMEMEYVDGPSFDKVLSAYAARGETVPLPVVLHVFSHVCKGLHYAHQARDSRGKALNIVHCDLKPSNILLGRFNEVKIADFGIARARSNLDVQRHTGAVVGTIRYMSPEQAQGDKNLDRRSDLFSLGLVLYEALALEPCYQGETPEITLRLAQDAEISYQLARIPSSAARDELIGLLLQALARDPAERFQTAAEFEKALDAVRELLNPRLDVTAWFSSVGAMAARADMSTVPPQPTGEPGTDEESWDWRRGAPPRRPMLSLPVPDPQAPDRPRYDGKPKEEWSQAHTESWNEDEKPFKSRPERSGRGGGSEGERPDLRQPPVKFPSQVALVAPEGAGKIEQKDKPWLGLTPRQLGAFVAVAALVGGGLGMISSLPGVRSWFAGLRGGRDLGWVRPAHDEGETPDASSPATASPGEAATSTPTAVVASTATPEPTPTATPLPRLPPTPRTGPGPRPTWDPPVRPTLEPRPPVTPAPVTPDPSSRLYPVTLWMHPWGPASLDGKPCQETRATLQCKWDVGAGRHALVVSREGGPISQAFDVSGATHCRVERDEVSCGPLEVN